MTALAPEPVGTGVTFVLVDVQECGADGVRWAAACAEALGTGLVVLSAEEDDAVLTAAMSEHPGLSVRVAHRGDVRREGSMVVVSRASALAMPPLACRDLSDVVVLGGSRAALSCCFGVVTAILEPVGGEGVLRRAVSLCRARQATRLRVLSRPYWASCDLPDAVADALHAACPGVIVELVRQVRSVRDEVRLFPSDLLVVSGRERGPAEGLQPAARAALHLAACPVLFSCS
ncbi:hypothetical protein SAMN05216553_101388 [Lentzea fradiae]|uniref:Universal stress protein family protein n=1 Tax=Lentzea fradiae TaxID=200378 RepID=A0A1G7KNL5_9PSEU|nr:hypothetical protein [Lentzea fradiae]SDF38777.1 hypothetical protein SAMN05216553_101388 [Lentzea fradiae]